MPAHAILLNIDTLLFMIFVVNAPQQAKLATTVSLVLMFGVSVTFATVLYVLRKDIPYLFVNTEKGASYAPTVLPMWAPIFRGAGQQKVAATVNGVAYYVVGIPLAGILGFYRPR
ncbi:hypothetical protein CCR75_002351 [Bremia lactucae]|uniref:Uncharacterized protein n=1 Tax=Bremia lactucae TaxID=4779 RepID=A0A976FNA0_BRELC|nr:hypothetical protein CCR75_002351 [Bremia lactucae]